MASWNALNEYTVCWNTFTTGMPRTYSVPVLFMRTSDSWYFVMKSMPRPPIIFIMHSIEMTTAARQASPRRQSNTKNMTSMPRIMATDPAVSGSLWASSPSVDAAQPSTTRRSAPDAWLSK